jgi:hypothetical protein
VAPDELEKWRTILDGITADLVAYYPKALILFGSMARWFAGSEAAALPNDIDVLMIGGNLPPVAVEARDYGFQLELHRLSEYQIVEIARSLRYDVRALALSKLYSKVLAKSHAIDVIAAAMLLGSEYRRFGIEQIEIDGIEDRRDYSIHMALYGGKWWRQLADYARNRRGPIKRLRDKLLWQDRFQPEI